MNCPHCNAEDSLEVNVDAYKVYAFKGFLSTGEAETGQELRVDEFDDVRVVCTECSQDVTVHDFDNPKPQHRGNCYDCGERALFCAPDMYGEGKELTTNNLLCGIHAANAVAFDGERIVPLFWDDTDYGDDGPPEEWVHVQAAYPLIQEG